MNLTLSVIKADIGSIGGHIQPSHELFQTVQKHVAAQGKGLILDSYLSYTGDDIAILMTHTHGTGHADVHRLAWDAFVAGTKTAKEQGLYGAGQDLLKDAFSGNVTGLGPAVAEIRFDQSSPSLAHPVRDTRESVAGQIDDPTVRRELEEIDQLGSARRLADRKSVG